MFEDKPSDLRSFNRKKVRFIPARLVLGVVLFGLTGCQSMENDVVYRWSVFRETLKPGPSHLYRDPHQRFHVTPPGLQDPVTRVTEEGVVFSGHNGDGVEVNYGIFVYDIPVRMPIAETTLLETTERIYSRLRGMGHEVEELRHEPIYFDGYPAFNLKYYVAFEDKTYRMYLSHLVKTDSAVFNLYYSVPLLAKVPYQDINAKHLSEAERWCYTISLFPNE